jgi:hypothetical protein
VSASVLAVCAAVTAASALVAAVTAV